MQIPFEKHVLANGLSVVLHHDPTDPLVALQLTYHVGSARERRGLSGFAHLFEHMLFQGSENVPEGAFFKSVQECGGSLNGSTNQDRTNYWEVVPREALELALFLEADRMGRLLPAMTQAKLDNQRDVVKNERRQNYDNRPYGRVHETLLAALYPPEHPYSWSTIGSMEDIDAATLEDVSAFFRRWYGPNNATLALGGDFDPERALELVEEHFGALAPCPGVDRPAPRPATLEASVRIVHEDRIRQPQLSLVWPTVEAWHPDEPALNLLADVLSANKASLFDRVLQLEEHLASHVTIWPQAGELAGFLRVDLRPAPGHTLGELETRVDELLERLLAEGLDAARLERLQARREGAWLRSLETVTARTGLLSHYDCFHGTPERLQADLERHRAVSCADVLAAARRWIVGRPRVALSAVPQGQRELASSGSRVRVAAPEPRRPAPTALPEVDEPGAPGPGSRWTTRLSNAVEVLGMPFEGVPLARLSLGLDAGRLREAGRSAGLAALCAELLEEGTERRSSSEWTDTLDGLGATFAARSGNDELVLSLSVLEERLPSAVELLGELLRAPRFAPEDFRRARAERLVALETLPDRAAALADEVFRARVHGVGTPMGAPQLGTREGIEALEREDVQAFWRAGRGARGACLAYVGGRSAGALRELLEPWCDWWPASAQPEPAPPGEDRPRPGLRLALVPKPGAPQAELRVGHPCVARSHPDFEGLEALNHLLGGSFTSRINLNLREDKGYTYGARSAFVAGAVPGRFCVATAVDTPNAVAALEEVLKELRGILGGVREDEVAFARRSLSQALALQYGSTAAKLALLEQMAKYGLPADYLAQKHARLARLEAAGLDALAREHLHPDALDVVVVGDPEALLEPLQALGELCVLGPDGAPALAAAAG